MSKENKKKNTAAEILYRKRFDRHFDELRWLYMELYDNGSMFAELCDRMEEFYRERNRTLKALDKKRESDPAWYRGNSLMGMMFYIDKR